MDTIASAVATTTRLFCARIDGRHERWCGARADHVDTHGHPRHAGIPRTCVACHADALDGEED